MKLNRQKIYKMSLLKGRNYYKPFTYPEFYNKWDKHEKSHWLPSEVPMHDDGE